MLRLILISLALFIFFIPFGIPALLLLWLLGLFAPKTKDRLAMAIVRAISWLILFLSGSKITAQGLENIPPQGPVLFVSNHRGLADIFCALILMRKPCCYITKQEWGRIPLLKQWMDAMHCIFLDRSNPRAGLAVFHRACGEMEKGNSIWVCPEGTRAHDNQLLHFKEGSFRPAFQTGSPILPVTFVRTDELFELHKPFIRPANITVIFGKCIPTAGLSRPEQRAIIEQIQREVQATYDTLV